MAKKLTRKETIATLQAIYPKFNKVAACMAAHPERYGVCLTRAAQEALGIAPKKKPENRSKTKRLSVRLEDKVYDRFMYMRKQSGFTTNQEYLEWIIGGL